MGSMANNRSNGGNRSSALAADLTTTNNIASTTATTVKQKKDSNAQNNGSIVSNGNVVNNNNKKNSKTQRLAPDVISSTTTNAVVVEDVHAVPSVLTQLGNFKLHVQFNASFLAIVVLSFLTRFWRLDHPRSVVLDELVYGNFAAMYMRRQFFFDKGPVLGKQLIALFAYLAGYDGLDQFQAVGDQYRPTTPIWYMRFMPAVCGAMTPPLVYKLVKALGYSELAACAAAFMIIFDTAFLTVSRFILMDSMVICFSVAAVHCAVRIIQLALPPQQPVAGTEAGGQKVMMRSISTVAEPNPVIASNHPALWNDRLKWCLALSICLALVINMKYAGFSILIFIAILLAVDYCRLLDRRDISYKFFLHYLLILIACVFVIPLLIHSASWAAHVLLLNRAGGTNDNVMSVRFQSSLEGGLNFLAQNQPYNISYGSQITLRNTKGAPDASGRPCWLHSHADLWPLRYSDERGSSHQQQVTCYTHKDANNFWIVKHPDRKTLHVENPIEFVRDNDVVQLVHGLTGRMLNSHDVAAPVSPDSQEVACYVDYNINMTAEPLWRVHLLQKFEGDEQWHPLVHQLQLVHETSGQVLSVTDKALPEVAFNQGEVACTRHLQSPGSVWLVEEHRYFEERMVKDDHERRLEVLKMDILPQEPQHMSFWEKFYECMFKLLMSRKESAEDHLYSSSPLEWLTMTRGVAFWLNPTSSAQIFLIGNVVVWYCAALSVFGVLLGVAVGAAWLQYKTRGNLHTPSWLERLMLAVRVLAGAYLSTFVPHLVTDNSLFVTQYLQSLVFGVALAGVLCEELALLVWRRLCQRNDERWLRTFAPFLLLWCTFILWVWYKMVPFSYGLYAFQPHELRALEWKETWDFIKR